MSSSIKKVLMERDGMTAAQADEAIAEARKEMYRRLGEGDMPDEICMEEFGLEPDYIFDLLD